MKYERAYHEEPDKWLPIGEKYLQEVFRQSFEEENTAIKQLQEGKEVRTSFATYRNRQKKNCT